LGRMGQTRFLPRMINHHIWQIFANSVWIVWSPFSVWVVLEARTLCWKNWNPFSMWVVLAARTTGGRILYPCLVHLPHSDIHWQNFECTFIMKQEPNYIVVHSDGAGQARFWTWVHIS
jgi:hypothetical protein